nr:hypothetical protein Q903MT_gene6270 [Picea sitchensis]
MNLTGIACACLGAPAIPLASASSLLRPLPLLLLLVRLVLSLSCLPAWWRGLGPSGLLLLLLFSWVVWFSGWKGSSQVFVWVDGWFDRWGGSVPASG